MNTSQPPYLARLVLERLAPPNESLVGDLAEAYRGGRSGVWYWRQVVGAIAAAGIREVQTHPVAVVGWIYQAATTPPPNYGVVVYAPIPVVMIALVVMPAAALLGGLWAAGTKSSPARRLRHDDSDAA